MQLNTLVSTAQQTRVAAYASDSFRLMLENELAANFDIFYSDSLNVLKEYLLEQSIITIPEIVLIEIMEGENGFELVAYIKKDLMLKGLIIVLLSLTKNEEWIQKAKKLNVHDFYTYPFPIDHLAERMMFLVKFKLIRPNLSDLSNEVKITYKVPFSKRLVDVLFASFLIILLSPIFLLVALLIVLGSRGPVIYKSKRVGTGYKIFYFYKFRSMRKDADAMLSQLASLNQYAQGENSSAAFVKIKDDPRITRVGKIIRKTSIDELPQLFNVLKGDMSVVGNRPLPLYEAEMLTSNEWAFRFLAPSGMTGLWQISRRGKEEMSERERKKLDNFYAKKYSFWFDFKIIMETFPAILQKEKV